MLDNFVCPEFNWKQAPYNLQSFFAARLTQNYFSGGRALINQLGSAVSLIAGKGHLVLSNCIFSSGFYDDKLSLELFGVRGYVCGAT